MGFLVLVARHHREEVGILCGIHGGIIGRIKVGIFGGIKVGFLCGID